MILLDLQPEAYAEVRMKLIRADRRRLIIPPKDAAGERLTLSGVVAQMEGVRPRHVVPAEVLPLILYFGTLSDRAEFIKIIRVAKPGMVEMVTLP